MVVRFEVDACIHANPTLPVTSTALRTLSNVDDLIGALSGVTLRTEGIDAPLPASQSSDTFPTITVIPGGSIVPQSSIIELTTRSVRNAANYDWAESYPQLFLSQTPHHFLAVHDRGRFQAVNKRKLESMELKQVAANSIQKGLKQLRLVLDIIKELAVKHGERGRLSLVFQGGELRVYERTSQTSCLPDDVLQKFDL